MNEVFVPYTQESMDKEKISRLHHMAMELHGTMLEYRAMPCDSLQRRMFSTQDRYKDRLAYCHPQVTLTCWNAREREEFDRWMAYQKQAQELECELDVQVATGASLDKIAQLVGVPSDQRVK